MNVWYLVHVADSLTYTIGKALSQGGHEQEQATLLKVMIGAQIWLVALLTFVRWHQRGFWAVPTGIVLVRSLPRASGQH